MLAIDAIEMHDALLKNMRVDHPGKKVTIDFDFYQSTDDRARSPLSITFDAVESLSHIADLKRMQANAFAGNVNYWVPSSGPGTTYIYLVDGCIAITAGSISCAAEHVFE